MVKKALLLAATAISLSWNVKAQFQCNTDKVRAEAVKKNPQILIDEAKLKAEIDAQLYSIGALGKNTSEPSLVDDTDMIYIPIVFHIVHEYGSEYVTDDAVYAALKEINDMYNHRNADTADLILPYKGNIPGTSVRYSTNSHITFLLPTKDPQGRPTNGITRRKSYLTYLGGDQAKLDIWPNSRFINVWIIRNFSSDHYGAAAYAYQPASANNLPFWDGVIAIANGGNFNFDNTIAHELGHSLNLNHPWGSVSGLNGNNPPCGDDDVDDTPPTHGHTNAAGCTPANLYDSSCASGYSLTYSAVLAHKLFKYNDTVAATIDFPDTTNSQNVMDYTYCSKMFSYMQRLRMRAALNNTAGGRDSLWTPTNLVNTGCLDANGNLVPRPNLSPIADFSIDHPVSIITNNTQQKFFVEMSFNTNVFTCPNSSNIVFKDRTWRANNNTLKWDFSNGAVSPTSTSATVLNKFSTSGWVTVSLKATNLVSGSDSITNTRAVYVADTTSINAKDYIQEFNNADTANFPIFNYFDNDHKWQVVDNNGFYDNHCMKYSNYDHRTGLSTAINTPVGDYDDFYTPKYSFAQSDAGDLYLNFFTAGAFISNVPSEMADTLQISYSTNCGFSWTNLRKMVRSEIGNNGAQFTEFAPSGIWNWQPHSILLPTQVKSASNGVFFRFRYYVGGDAGLFGTGNNFYLDRMSFSHYTAAVSTPNFNQDGIAIAPNPTSNSSFVVIKDSKDKTAQIVVTDLTGKIVYSTEAALLTGTNRIEIPANVISVKGMYLVQIISETSKHTEKLVVY